MLGSMSTVGPGVFAPNDLPSKGEQHRLGRDWVPVLKPPPLFEGMSSRHLRRIPATTRHFQAGEAIVRVGDPGSGFCVILDGEVRVDPPKGRRGSGAAANARRTAARRPEAVLSLHLKAGLGRRGTRQCGRHQQGEGGASPGKPQSLRAVAPSGHTPLSSCLRKDGDGESGNLLVFTKLQVEGAKRPAFAS